MSCRSFGHLSVACPCSTTPVPLPARIPLPRPPVRKWVSKVAPSPSNTPPDVATASVPSVVAHVVPIQLEIALSILAPTCPDQTDLATSSVAPYVVAHAIPAQPVCESLFESIYWNSEERAWIHDPSETRYSSESGKCYAFISNVVGESRSLLYHIDNEGLSLTRLGEIGEVNKSKFYNVNWERKYIYIYSPSSEINDPNLAIIFSGFVKLLAGCLMWSLPVCLGGILVVIKLVA